jgi:outer membrane protein assembly factor BamB
VSSSRSVAFAIHLLPGLASIAGAQSMFRGGPDHLGVYESAAPSLATVAWKFKTNGRVISSPVVVGDAVYVGSTDGNLYAINRADGALRWKFTTRGAVNSSPAFANGVVYVNSVDGKFYAVDAATGTEKWSFKTGGERRFTAPGIHGRTPSTEMMPDVFDVFLSSPVIANGSVYFGSGDGNVYALDAAGGALEWKFKTGDVVHASPAVSNGVVFVGSWDRNMYALNAATGKEVWRFQTGNDTVIYNQIGIASSAAVAGGVVYFGCRDGHFYAVDQRTGKQRWVVDNKGGWVIASPAVANGVVYFPTSDGRRFKAVDASTGAIKFNVENKAISFSSPAIVGGAVYFGSSDGWLHVLDVATGVTKAEFQSDGSKENSAKYIDADGHFKPDALYPDATLDGTIIGMHNMFTLGSFLSSAVVSGGVLYIGSTDGNLYAIR